MTKTESADVRAAGHRGGRGRLYACRVRGIGRSAVVLWSGGVDDEPDQVVTTPAADRRKVPVFMTARQARLYASRRGWELAASEAGTLDLTRVQRWLEDPVRRSVPPGAVLDAWNFFEDLVRGLDEVHRLPRQEAVHDSAYEKLFAGGCTAWTSAEQRAVRGLITAGVELWNSCPVIVKPRSGHVFDSARVVTRGP